MSCSDPGMVTSHVTRPGPSLKPPQPSPRRPYLPRPSPPGPSLEPRRAASLGLSCSLSCYQQRTDRQLELCCVWFCSFMSDSRSFVIVKTRLETDSSSQLSPKQLSRPFRQPSSARGKASSHPQASTSTQRCSHRHEGEDEHNPKLNRSLNRSPKLPKPHPRIERSITRNNQTSTTATRKPPPRSRRTIPNPSRQST